MDCGFCTVVYRVYPKYAQRSPENAGLKDERTRPVVEQNSVIE
jgi:hypothetical protein